MEFRRVELSTLNLKPKGPCIGCRFYNKKTRHCKNGIDTFTKKFRCAFRNVSRYLKSAAVSVIKAEI